MPPTDALPLPSLQNLDIVEVVSSFTRDNQDPLVKSIVLLLNAIQGKEGELQRLINKLISTLTDRQFYDGLLTALKAHVEAHPWTTAFFIVGVILLCNPLAMAGFGTLGPVAGSLAAAWQSTMEGTVAAGSAFAILQSWGMAHSIVIPAVGAIIVSTSIAAGVAGDQIAKSAHDACIVANAGGKEVEKWSKGEYGEPVKNWWNGAYGDQVTRWWKGDYGTPVEEWVKSVKKL